MPPIVFSFRLMSATSDVRMMNDWKDNIRTPSFYYYAGITEDPEIRMLGHLNKMVRGQLPTLMRVIVVMSTSKETAEWEKMAIKFLRSNFDNRRILNVGPGGECPSQGEPHYGYILEFGKPCEDGTPCESKA